MEVFSHLKKSSESLMIWYLWGEILKFDILLVSWHRFNDRTLIHIWWTHANVREYPSTKLQIIVQCKHFTSASYFSYLSLLILFDPISFFLRHVDFILWATHFISLTLSFNVKGNPEKTRYYFGAQRIKWLKDNVLSLKNF